MKGSNHLFALNVKLLISATLQIIPNSSKELSISDQMYASLNTNRTSVLTSLTGVDL